AEVCFMSGPIDPPSKPWEQRPGCRPLLARDDVSRWPCWLAQPHPRRLVDWRPASLERKTRAQLKRARIAALTARDVADGLPEQWTLGVALVILSKVRSV